MSWYSILCLLVDLGAVVLTVVAFLCISTTKDMDHSFQIILVSFSLANLVGSVLFFADTIHFICWHHKSYMLDSIEV